MNDRDSIDMSSKNTGLRCRYQGEVRTGAVLPAEGVTYYDVPSEYGVREYRYTVVNDRPFLVDPRTRRIVEVVE